jgi:hypothetical protein
MLSLSKHKNQFFRSLLKEAPGFSLFNFLGRFAIDAERRDRAGLQTVDTDLFAADLAYPVFPVFQSAQGFLDLAHELSLPVPDAQDGVAIGLKGSAVRGVREVFFRVHPFNCFACLGYEILQPSL